MHNQATTSTISVQVTSQGCRSADRQQEIVYSQASEIPEALKCRRCRCPFEDPVVFTCGAMTCGKHEQTDCKDATCTRTTARVQRPILEQLDCLKAVCPNCSLGLLRGDLPNHLYNCPVGEPGLS